MSGLYSPINRLMEQVTRPKGTGAEYMTELAKKPGYKPAEAEDRDLQTLMALPQMQRAEFMEKLKGQANKFPLKITGKFSINITKWVAFYFCRIRSRCVAHVVHPKWHHT